MNRLSICLSKDYVPIRKLAPEWQGFSSEAMKVLTIEEANYFYDLYLMNKLFYERFGGN